MGSGFVMNAYVLRAMRNLNPNEQKEALEALGIDYLVDTFSERNNENFETFSKRGAELVRLAIFRDFRNKFGNDYPFSVNIVEYEGKFKIAFFK